MTCPCRELQPRWLASTSRRQLWRSTSGDVGDRVDTTLDEGAINQSYDIAVLMSNDTD